MFDALNKCITPRGTPHQFCTCVMSSGGALQSLKRITKLANIKINNPDDVTVMSSELSQLGLAHKKL